MNGDLATRLGEILPDGTDPDQRREFGHGLADIITDTINDIVDDRMMNVLMTLPTC